MLIVGTAYAFSLSSALVKATIVELDYTQIASFCFAMILFLSLWLYNKYTLLIGSGIMAVSGVVMFIISRVSPENLSGISGFIDTATEIGSVLQGTILAREDHKIVMVIGITFLLSLFTTINFGKFFNILLPALLGIIVFTIPAALGYKKSEEGLLIFIICFIILLIKRLNIIVLPSDNSTVSLIAIPVALLMVMTAFALPKPEVEKGADATKSRIQTASEVVERAAGILTENFEIPLSNDGKKLGGSITMSDEVVMNVSTDKPVYLAGTIYDTYNGSSWRTSENTKITLEPNTDGFYEIIQHNEDFAAEQQYIKKYYAFSENNVKVNMDQNRTRLIFSPPSNLRFISDQDFTLKENTHGVLSSNRIMPENTQYTQQYIGWDYNNTYFKEYLRGKNLDIIQTDSLVEIETCLKLPEIPDRLVSLTFEITGKATNDYDKIKAIEEFLAAYPYTLETANVPNGQDFVDYFIFTEKQGYCVYYATALAVMGRIEGIPTRYVEGYVMPPERNEQGGFTVTGKQAHAWTEVYFEDFGWVRFEPTSPYFADTYMEEIPLQEVDLEEFQNIESEFKQPEEPEEKPPEPEENELPETEEEIPAVEEKRSYKGIWIFLGVAVSLGALAFVVWKKIESNKKFWKDLEEKPNREAVIIYYSFILRAKKALGYEIENGETAIDFARRIEPELAEGNIFGDITHIFTKAAYSKSEITDDERNLVVEYYEHAILAVESSYKIKPVYYVAKYLFRKY